MARCPERQRAIRARLEPLGLDYEIFYGVDGNTLKQEDYAHRINKEYWRCLRGRNLSAGEIGCFISHYSLWEMLIKNNLQTAIILEDDCILQPCFTEVVREILTVEYKWDIVLLSARKQYAIDRVLCKIGNGRRLVRFRRRVGTARAYMIQLPATKQLINYCYKIRAPIDWLYAEWWYNRVQFYAITPGITIQDNVPSVIGKPSRLPRTLEEWFWARKHLIMSFVHRHWHRLTIPPQKKEFDNE